MTHFRVEFRKHGTLVAHTIVLAVSGDDAIDQALEQTPVGRNVTAKAIPLPCPVAA